MLMFFPSAILKREVNTYVEWPSLNRSDPGYIRLSGNNQFLNIGIPLLKSSQRILIFYHRAFNSKTRFLALKCVLKLKLKLFINYAKYIFQLDWVGKICLKLVHFQSSNMKLKYLANWRCILTEIDRTWDRLFSIRNIWHQWNINSVQLATTFVWNVLQSCVRICVKNLSFD